MEIGYDRPLYVLPIAHRATYSQTWNGVMGPLATEQTARITVRETGT